ncbi:MAG: hypothetical protein ACYDG2_12360 [Ruminiclostridium sp.]
MNEETILEYIKIKKKDKQGDRVYDRPPPEALEKIDRSNLD